MRFLATSLVVLLATITGGSAVRADEPAKEPALLRHVVLFQFKDGVKEEEVQEVVDAFAALKSKIDVIVDLEYGTDVGVEGLSQDFTHGWVVTFKDAKGRDTYLPHPAHKKFVELVKPRLEKVLVFDFFVKKP